jgi:hypothetical protein
MIVAGRQVDVRECRSWSAFGRISGQHRKWLGSVKKLRSWKVSGTWGMVRVGEGVNTGEMVHSTPPKASRQRQQ